jgi:hypothetical protein
MADYNLLAQYPKQAIVRDRNYSGLLAWAGYTLALAVPATKPDAAWVEQRIVAERIPSQTQVYVDRTIAYFLKDPTTQTNIRQYLNAWNDETTEAALSDQISSVVSAFMPGFCALEVTQADVDSWYAANGFPDPPV